MSDYLCISATFLDGRFHGRGDGGRTEWPPSPLRLLQALVAANADQLGNGGALPRAIEWLERRPPPIIVAPPGHDGAPYRLSVPNNAMDLVGRAYAKGNYFGTGDANPATHRAMKEVRPVLLQDVGGNADRVSYLWPIDEAEPAFSSDLVSAMVGAARRIVALGWGIDLVVGDASQITASEANALRGERWLPTPGATNSVLRTPVAGTLSALIERHESGFLRRIHNDTFHPVPPLTAYRPVGYRRPADPIGRPNVVFKLEDDAGNTDPYPQRHLIHIAGMVRNRAIAAMKENPPPGLGDQRAVEEWIDQYVAGHQAGDSQKPHRQLSYVPLPSIGHRHTDPAVRRVMIVAPHGDHVWLEHLADRLAGQRLQPDPARGSRLRDPEHPPSLVRLTTDNVARRYCGAASVWASVTPVILPGHTDNKPSKTRRLIETALAQSGIEQHCEFEWSPISRFPKSLTAHRSERSNRATGYTRPDHLASYTAVHVLLRFDDGSNAETAVDVAGPMIIGAGRHCGFGLMATLPV